MSKFLTMPSFVVCVVLTLATRADAGCAINSSNGRVFCGPGSCANNRTTGEVWCSKYEDGGAAVNTKSGIVACGVGQCAVNGKSGIVACSSEVDGEAMVGRDGNVYCTLDGTTSADNCVLGKVASCIYGK